MTIKHLGLYVLIAYGVIFGLWVLVRAARAYADAARRRRIEAETAARDARATGIAETIAAAFRKEGIDVSDASARCGLVFVTTLPTPEQTEKFREIAAAMLVAHADNSQTHNSVIIKPLQLLDRAWAERYGREDWAEEFFSAPCADCGKRASLGWHYGRQALAHFEARADKDPREWEITVRQPDGRRRFVYGNICQDCLGDSYIEFMTAPAVDLRDDV